GGSMLPLVLLKTAQGHPVLIELKSGETYNGHLVLCDTWMNIHLREVICTSKDGDRFWRMPEAYVRGNTIKYLRVPDEVIDKAKEETLRRDGELRCGDAFLIGGAGITCHGREDRQLHPSVVPCPDRSDRVSAAGDAAGGRAEGAGTVAAAGEDGTAAAAGEAEMAAAAGEAGVPPMVAEGAVAGGDPPQTYS
ncbi:hypothetical protein APUTEX25_000022, partial [Auxenochlorella protothecoides]